MPCSTKRISNAFVGAGTASKYIDVCQQTTQKCKRNPMFEAWIAQVNQAFFTIQQRLPPVWGADLVATSEVTVL